MNNPYIQKSKEAFAKTIHRILFVLGFCTVFAVAMCSKEAFAEQHRAKLDMNCISLEEMKEGLKDPTQTLLSVSSVRLLSASLKPFTATKLQIADKDGIQTWLIDSESACLAFIEIPNKSN